MSRVVLYTIPGRCTLCDEAREAMSGAGIEFDEVDVRTDRALLRAYRLEIPVITVDDRKEFIGRVDIARLRELITDN